jgi:hypothetical protein
LPRLASAEIAQREEAALSAAQAKVADAQGRLNAASAQVAKLAEEIEATEALGHVTPPASLDRLMAPGFPRLFGGGLRSCASQLPSRPTRKRC